MRPPKNDKGSKAMAETANGAGKSAMRIDPALVRELAELLTENSLTEIEVEDGDRKIKVCRNPAAIIAGGAPAAAPAAAAPAPTTAPAPAAPAEPAPVSGEAVKSIKTPVIEVHLSDPDTRESFRHVDYVAMAATQVIKGRGADGYLAALDAAARLCE